MAIIRDFTYEPHRDSNFVGLKPAWFDNADPTTGRGVAHDMLEHFRTQVGPVEGEMEAFGAFLAIRLEQGALVTTHRTDVVILADDVCSVLVDLFELDLPVPSPKASRRLPDIYADADTTITLAVARGMRQARSELAARGTEESTYGAILTAALEATLVAWIRQGYRRALKRYEQVDLYRLGNTFFKQIEKCLDALLRSEFLAIGDQVRVALDPRNWDIRVKVNGRCAQELGYL
jgi:hypothetical protein